MSRSFRKRIYSTCCGNGNKYARALANRTMRRANALKLKEAVDRDEDFVGATLREVSNVWNFPSDGLARYEARGVEALVSDLWSEAQSAINTCGKTGGSLHDMRQKFGFYPHGFWDAEEICRAIDKPFTLETLESLTNDDVRLAAMNRFHRWYRRR